MKEDNNPFQPTLAKPADDSVLATDAAADNFLAGNDQFAQRAGVTIDNVKPVPTTDNTTAPHLDQMATTANNQTESAGGMMLGEPITTPDISSFGDLDTTSTPTMPDLFNNAASKKEKKSKAKKPLFGGKKATDNADATNNKTSVENVFGSTNNNPLNNEPISDLANTIATAEIGNSDSDSDTATSPISASLAAAAEAADGKSGGIELTPANQSKKNKGSKTNQPKQLTISVLTIVFFVLFLGATATAVYFGIQNNKNSNELSDAQAKLQQLTDENNSSTTSSNKSSTQFDALQDKIADLTTQNEEKQKTIDENKTTIDNLNKQVTDLNTKLTDTQNKLTSDTQVSDKMQSLITTMCANDPYKTQSSVCIEANGGNAGGQTAGATNQTQPAGQ